MVRDSLAPGLAVVFVGFNPSPASSAAGFPYAHPSNRFYRLLHAAGLTSVVHPPSANFDMLHLYGYGFTNIVARTTRRAGDLTATDYARGRVVLHRKLQTFAPAIACFVGKGVYLAWSGRRRCDVGFVTDPAIAGVREFVAPGTSGLVRMAFADQVAAYQVLAQAVDELRRAGYRPPLAGGPG